jgi:hypothetical protein
MPEAPAVTITRLPLALSSMAEFSLVNEWQWTLLLCRLSP